jgi:type III pantothenate kinase
MCISKILSYFAGETKKENVNLVIDIGNTVAKLAVFDGDKVVEVLRGSNHSLDWLSMLCNKYPIKRGIIASVITLSNTIRRQLAGVPFEIIELNHLTPIPIRNLYKTPETLGMDRLAAVVGANYLSPGRNLLVVDAGTALTYEFIDAEGNYWGGNISPGIYTRFKTLNACCDKLPLIERKGETPEFGFDTETAIRAGVIRGIEFEIIGYITLLQKKYPDLLVFLTGGDKFSFDTNLKSIIFADRFLVLKGLNRILNYNVK